MYQLEFTQLSDYLHVVAHGVLDSRTDLQIDLEIRRECETRQLHSALIDIRPMTSRLSGVQNHNAAKTFRERMGSVSSVAIVELPQYRDRSEMFQLTAGNRDANVRFFNEESAAAQWLSEQAPI